MPNNTSKTTLTFLGTGAALTRKGRYPCGVVIDDSIIIDAPPQALNHLKKMNIPPERLDAVFITHLHPDHILGLITIAQEWIVSGNRPNPAPLFVHEGGEKTILRLLQTALEGVEFDYSNIIEFHPLPLDYAQYEIKGVRFDAAPLDHSAPALGYNIHHKGTVIGFSGDTQMCGQLSRIMDADVSVVEMTFVDEKYPGHMNMLDDLPSVYGMLSERQRLFLYHLTDENEDIIKKLKGVDSTAADAALQILADERVTMAEDMKRYEV